MKRLSSRRKFILGGGALLLSCVFIKLFGARQISRSDSMIIDTIVIGAGPAGLSAARTLSDAGFSVIVIEARQRIGGRMWTNHSFSEDLPVELGAELIHGGPAENSLWEIVERRKIKAQPIKHEYARHSPNSEWISTETKEFFEFPMFRPSRPTSFDPLPSDSNAEEYLNRLGIEKGNRPLALLATSLDSEQFDKMHPSEIFEFVQELWPDTYGTEVRDTGEDDFKVIGGYDKIISDLSDGLNIKYETVVTCIEDKGDSVRMKALYNNELVEFNAKNCVVTIPAPVLLNNSVEFIPPLSNERLSALRDGSMIPVAKIIMEFERKIMPLNADVLSDFSQMILCIWNASACQPNYKGQILIGWATGDGARKLLALSETERYAHMLEVVRNITAEHDLTYSKAIMHDWSKDPYSLGAYGYWDDEDSILKNEGNIHWAGVVKSQVDYAHDSGVKAAEEIMRNK